MRQPVDCDLGQTCFIQQFVDRDPGPSAQDFACGPLSYDGHKGTDFGLPSISVMRAGVEVLAAAPGIVSGVRDGMADTGYTKETAPEIEGRECGNGVVIKHGDGWQTQYCHLKRGSVRVRSGDTVAAGEVLGQIGLSGKTQFPHVHLSVRKNGKVIDPFAPNTTEICGEADETLWATTPEYTPTGVLNAGFSTGIPSFAQVKDGPVPKPLKQMDEALVLWVYAFGSQPDDVVQLTISGPSGVLLSKNVPLEKTQAQYFRAVGKRRPRGGFPSGKYLGDIRLIRNGQEVDHHQTLVFVE
ncbi:MAG: M23 family metallopeptidase [Thalassovita sp.]